MKDQKSEKAVVFVTRSGLQFFGANSSSVVSLAFDNKVVSDLDLSVVGPLSTKIQAFIDQNKLSPSPVLFVFSEPTCFYSDTREGDESKLKSLLSDFVNTIPFETLITKVYRNKDGARIVSVNEKLYREIASAFESKGFLSVGVVPWFVLGGKTGIIPALDMNTARQILANIESIKTQSFLAAQEIEGENGSDSTPSSSSTSQKSNKNILILGGVLLVLIIVFGILLISQS